LIYGIPQLREDRKQAELIQEAFDQIKDEMQAVQNKLDDAALEHIGKKFIENFRGDLDASDFSIVKEIETRCSVSDIKYTADGKYIILAGGGIGGISILDAESFQIVKEITKVANDVKGMKIDGVKGLDPVLEEALRRGI
jgi:hypothetical protein